MKLKQGRSDCEKETGVNPQLIDDAKKGKFADDAKLKDFLVCLSKKIGFVNDKGELQHAVLIEKSTGVLGDKAQAEKLNSECAVQKSSLQDTVFDSMKCYHEKSGKPILV